MIGEYESLAAKEIRRIWIIGIAILLGVLLGASLAKAQGTQTIYEAPLTNVSVVPVNSVSIRNIGQSGHLMWIRLYNAPAKICAAPQTVAITFQASFEGTIWTTVGTAVTTVAQDAYGQLITTTTAQGAFPYIRVNITTLDVVNCRCDIKYSGTVGSQAVVSLSTGSTGGGGSTPVTLPLYKAPTLVTTSFDYSAVGNDWQACKDILNASGEAGRVNFVAVRLIADNAFNPMTPAESIYIRTRADGLAYTTMLPLFVGIAPAGTIGVTETARDLTSNYSLGGGNITANFILPMQLDYTNTVQMQICPNPVPLGSGAQLTLTFDASVARSIVQ